MNRSVRLSEKLKDACITSKCLKGKTHLWRGWAEGVCVEGRIVSQRRASFEGILI